MSIDFSKKIYRLIHIVSNWLFQGLVLGGLYKNIELSFFYQRTGLAWGIVLIDFLIIKTVLSKKEFVYSAFDMFEDAVFIIGIIVIMFCYNLPNEPEKLIIIRLSVVLSECVIALERFLLLKKAKQS